MVGVYYSFTPTASDPDGDALTFSGSNLPAWSNLNTTTGELSGEPSANDVGTTNNITISVADALEISELPPFANVSLDEAVRVSLEEGYSRVPVYGKDRDDVIGVLYAHDLLAHWGDGATASDTPPCVRDLMRPPFFVPENKSLNDLLKEMRARKVHMAVVLDEFNGTEGLVTIEDLLEEIVGEIEDEYDDPSDESSPTAHQTQIPPVRSATTSATRTRDSAATSIGVAESSSPNRSARTSRTCSAVTPSAKRRCNWSPCP